MHEKNECVCAHLGVITYYMHPTTRNCVQRTRIEFFLFVCFFSCAMKMIKVAMGGGPATAGISERGSGLQHSVCFFFRFRSKASERESERTNENENEKWRAASRVSAENEPNAGRHTL